MSLKDKSIVVTGSSGGLGPEVVKKLLLEGAFCYLPVVESDVSHLESFLKEAGIDASQYSISYQIDFTKEEDVAAFYKEIAGDANLWGVVNLAGGFGMGKIENTSSDELERMLNLNTRTCFNSTKQAVKLLKKQSRGGRIVNVASRPGEYPRQGKGLVAYSMSKSAVVALTQSVAEEVRGNHLLVNAVSPSIIDTPDNRNAMPNENHDQWPKPADIANTIHFLVSSENKLTHGAIVPVYGNI